MSTAEFVGTIEDFDPKNERYLTARTIGKLFPIIYGQRGAMAAGFYSYFRWLDDVVDEGSMDKNSKLKLLNREIAIFEGERPMKLSKEEQLVTRLSSMGHPKGKEIMRQGVLLINALKEDVEGGDFKARTDREVRHYNWRTMLPCFEALSLIINNRTLGPNYSFMKMLDGWSRIGSLIDLEEDVDRGMLQLPFDRMDLELITSSLNSAKKLAVASIITRERFENMKREALTQVQENSSSFLDTSLPIWQKLLCRTYMAVRPIAKGHKARYPDSFR